MRDGTDQPVNNSQESVEQDRSESTPLYATTFDTGTLRLIVSFFFGFSVTVTVFLGIQLYYGNSKIAVHGSVVSDSPLCSNAAAGILKQGGNAVDAIIALAFCMGVVNPHITGLGSGGIMLVYDQRERKLLNSIDFRVTRSRHKAIGVPGFVAGLALAHQVHGSLPWKQLIQPAENFARNGFHVSQTLMESRFYLDPKQPFNKNLREYLESLILDEYIPNQQLADTLNYIGNVGSEDFYDKLLSELLTVIANKEDVKKYKALLGSGMKKTYSGYDIIVPGSGSGGPILLKNLGMMNTSLPPLLSAIETFKSVVNGWAPPTASHIAVMDVNDLYVTMVSSLGLVLGSQIYTKSGFILNNMLEITRDGSERPEALLTPTVVIQNGKVCGRRLVLGAGDVREIAQVLVYLLTTPTANITQVIEAPRVRIDTFKEPQILLEENRSISFTDIDVLSQDKNFNILKNVQLHFPSINVIEKVNDTMFAYADSRGFGASVTF